MSKTLKLLEALKEGMLEKKAENIVIIDFRDTPNAITDYFIICEANTGIQVNAIRESVEEFGIKSAGQKPKHIEGIENSEWIILDYFDVVVHIFQKQSRAYYKLEELWADAGITRIDTENLKKIKTN
jgi:ribosome-associated protein